MNLRCFLLFSFFLYFSSANRVESLISDVCSQHYYPIKSDPSLDYINLRWEDSIIVMILSCLSLISTSFVIMTFILYQEMREPPGDILLGISISEFILTLHWMISSGYFFLCPEEPPKSASPFCFWNSVFGLMAGTAEYVYNCIFCIFLIWKISSFLKGKNPKNFILHLLAISIIAALFLILFFQEKLGKNLFGTCSVKGSSDFTYSGFLILFIYVLISLGTIRYFKKIVPNNESFKDLRENFLNYYYLYVKACCFIWFFLALCNLIASVDFKINKKSTLTVFLTIGNCCKLCTPLILTWIRFKDPFLKKKFEKYYFRKKSVNHSTLGEELLEVERFDNLSLNWTEKITTEMKYSLTLTMISGVLLEHADHWEKKHINYKNREKYLLDKNTLNSINEVFDSVMYAEFRDVFRSLMALEKDLDLSESLNLEKNYQQIEKASGADGGRGGELFFFSYDNKVIIKTLSEKDFVTISSIIKDYYIYLKENPDSLITRILGIYTFERNEKYHICLMRNIANCDSKFKLATYDLKGSKLDREVLKKKNSQNSEIKKMVLKDLDFDSIEKKLYIDDKLKEKLLEILKKDSIFLKFHGLIDYSLLVFKIKKENRDENEKKNLKNLLSKSNYSSTFMNIFEKEKFNYKILKSMSEKEEGVDYHIGIIDYLQLYDISKWVENKMKSIANPNGDPSSQEAEYYQKRFMDYMKKIID